MKRTLTTLVLGCLILCCFNVKAQTPDTSTVKKLLHYIMQPLDKSQVPSGFLEEYGCPILPMATFNGILTDSNRVDLNLWRTLYYQLQTAYCQNGTNPLPIITNVNATIKQNKAEGLPIPIPLLIGQYDNVKTNAFSSNLLSYNNSTKQVSDVNGRSQNPYQTSNLFAACPIYPFTKNGTEDFILKSNLVYNNTGKTITAAQINFDDGQGLQSLTFDVPISVSYADTGLRRWTIKLTLSDNSILQCYSDYRVLKAAAVAQRFAVNNTTVPTWGVINAVNNVHSGAVITVAYSANNNTNTLRKPLIIVEGYDVSAIAPTIVEDYNINDFIGALIRESQPYDFNNQLDDVAGYDLVFINFNDGADDLMANALVVEEAINRVNANKVLDNRFGNIMQQNVIMGLSMGGLIGRYALAKMTKNNENTQTRLLITHDSPHHGANVPLGLQYLIRMMGNFELFDLNVRDIYADYDEALTLLDAPATRQLLIYRAVTETTFANNTFLDGAYRSMITFSPSDPQPSYRFIATSLGNECGNSLFSPGSTFINLGAGVSAGLYGRILFFKVPIVSYKLAAEVEAYALPNTGSTAKIARLYTVNNLKLFGFINIIKQLYNQTAYAPGNHLAIDGVPGSNYPILDFDGLDAITGLPSFNLNLNVGFNLGPYLGGYFGAYAYNNGVNINYTFVPVSSALDVSPFNTGSLTSRYVNSINGNYPSSSNGFIAQENNTNASISNNTHIRFTARNAEWLFNEMENVSNNTLNCSNNCISVPLNNSLLQGPNQFCLNGTYSIFSLPSNASITWFATGSLSISGSSNTNSVILTYNGSGSSGVLTASITTPCINTPVVLTKTIEPPVRYEISGPSIFCNDASYSINDLPANSTVVWSATGDVSLDLSSTAGSFAELISTIQNGYGTITATITTPCGGTTTSSMSVISSPAFIQNVQILNPIGQYGIPVLEGGTMVLQADDVPGAQFYEWYNGDNLDNLILTTTTPNLQTINYNYDCGVHSMTVRAYTTCWIHIS
ncbi:hypothetical protein A5893_13085 [Pedobacter psychrophilus]|uniref:DUF676 domain-containing protein n=1 Tax=Pedobacter psychrophilus TaxID=1826909 RepID=A0A179DD34_9SPHI|nr:hypothetical protein [Pedobacter psychrophilus]OAQ38966.1 hypothetical protein A5893_13085 [Pedobacter psychrophilus]